MRLPTESRKGLMKHAVLINRQVVILIECEEKEFDEVLLIGCFHGEKFSPNSHMDSRGARRITDWISQKESISSPLFFGTG